MAKVVTQTQSNISSQRTAASPILFLDDVVSSYDAEHKERIVDLIAERLGVFQVFLTTHDWRFYSMLKDRLHDKGWLFERVSGWDFEHGPKREVDAL